MSEECCHGTCWTRICIYLAIAIAIYAKFFRKRVFAYLLDGFAKSFRNFLHPAKKEIFNEAFEKLNKKKLKIVEIGVGTGTNFQYYPENAEIIISDKTNSFLPYLNESLKKISREDIKINDLIVSDAENMSAIESSSVDAVVATFTLCSVNNLSAVFNEIKRILKPGGVFIFMDHSKNTTSLKMNIIQTIVEPLWSFIFDNCKFRNIKTEFQSYSKFEQLEMRQHANCTTLWGSMLNPIFYGYAQKHLVE